jgi:hypothetical protein
MRQAVLVLCVALSCLSAGQNLWQEETAGLWRRRSDRVPRGGVDFGSSAQIVTRPGAASNIKRAASFLKADLEKLGVADVTVVEAFSPGKKRILIEVVPRPDRPESFRIETDAQGIVIQGADDRGAAFGVYELSKNLGIDPLYIWTGFTPERRSRLVVQRITFEQGPPAVRWRGLFHDDEDILPVPMSPEGYPDPRGTVPRIWYERFFETALRLKMNMVAPWVRTQRNFEIQKMASDWGLVYTSHHYDILLSDPYHFDKGLAEKRGVEPKWDWVSNREGIVKYWRAGVGENREIDAFYPIGLRGTNDYGYRFPADWTQDQRIGAFNAALQLQADLIDRILPKHTARRMHFTMYTEMLPYYQTGKLKVPDGATIVWPDDNDGNMRGLPGPGSTGKHGVYYHLAYLGGNLTKQVHQTVPLDRIEREFRSVLGAGATDYVLVNVSELREYVMGTRLIAKVLWQGEKAADSRQFLDWWSREYYGTRDAASAVKGYFDSIMHPAELSVGGMKCVGALNSLERKFAGQTFVPAAPETLPMLEARAEASRKYRWELERIQGTIGRSQPEKSRFFFENIELPASIDRLNTLAAIALVKAMSELSRTRALALCQTAMNHLNDLHSHLKRAERPPFEGWYGPTWIRERTQVLVEPRIRLAQLLQKHR